MGCIADHIRCSPSGEKEGITKHFGGNIFTGKTNRLDIVFCGNLIKKQDGEEQKDEPPRNGALSISSLKERIVMDKGNMDTAAAFLREVLKQNKLAVTVTVTRDIVKELYKLAKIGAGDYERVIHCRDCKSHGNITEDYCIVVDQETEDDFYCGYGRLKDGGKE